MEGAPKQYTKEEIAELEKSRTISDAKLLKKGAEYVIDDEGNKSGMSLTEEQENALRKNERKEKNGNMEQGVPLLKKILKEAKDDDYRDIKYSADISGRNYRVTIGNHTISLNEEEQFGGYDGYGCAIDGLSVSYAKMNVQNGDGRSSLFEDEWLFLRSFFGKLDDMRRKNEKEGRKVGSYFPND